MWLVQIFLPLEADTGGAFCNVKEELTKRFGGLTAYNRAPAEGLWRNGNKKEKDEIVIVEGDDRRTGPRVVARVSQAAGTAATSR